MGILKLLRPKQWLKNLMLFFPPLFGGVLFRIEVCLDLAIPVLAFCLASSANYAFNDVLDADKDALHPTKKNRPIPAGKVSKKSALFLSGVLLTAAFLSAFFTSWPFTLMLIAYVLLMGSYSVWLKHLVLFDIFCIAAGFLLRLEAGGNATGIPVSSWLFLSVFFLAVFLSTGKRFGEKLVLDNTASSHRKTLADYPDAYLDGLMLMTGTAAMLTYALYSIDHGPLIYTVPLCCLGLFRYLFWIKKGNSGDPTEALLQDRMLLGISIIWMTLVAFVVYG